MKFNPRQNLTILIFLIGFSVGWWSCTSRTPDLTFWVGGAPDEVTYWEILMQEFEKQTGHAVQVIRQPTDSDQRRQGLVISLEARQPNPDVFLMDVIWIGQFIASDWLEPLDPYFQKSDFSVKPFFQRVVDLVDRHDARLFGLPVYVDGGLLYFRNDLLSENGYANPPETWDELLHSSQKIQTEEQSNNPAFYGFVWQGAQYEGLVCTFLEFTASNGGGILIDGRIQLNHPKNVEALQFMQDLIHKYKISPPNTYTEMKEEQVRRYFQRGNALYERNWPYVWKLHESPTSRVKGKVQIAPLPHFAGGKTVSTLGGWHVGMSRYSDVKDQAAELIEFITSYATQKKLALNLGWNPGRTDVYADPEILEKLPHLSRLEKVFEHAVARPNLPYYTQVSETIQRYVNECLAGRIDPKSALDKAQQEVERINRWYTQKPSEN